MTLVGKIFTFLILLMSVAFLMLAVTVFATHRNWRDAVMGGADQPGLKKQVEEIADVNRRLREELECASDRLAIEQASRAYALAALQTRLEQAEQALSASGAGICRATGRSRHNGHRVGGQRGEFEEGHGRDHAVAHGVAGRRAGAR